MFHITEIVSDLKKARIAKGISQNQLANITGYDVNQISCWERGKHQPGIVAVIDLANALGFRLKLEESDIEFKPKPKPTGFIIEF
jgi:transcriptional regulator with XRE-family HTH domain